MIERIGLGPRDSVIDVGGGTSRLVDALLDRGFEDLTVLDVSSVALAEARGRLGTRAAGVRFVEADVTSHRPDRPFSLWHDRAVFHFLTEERDRVGYRQALSAGVAPGGHAIVATFSEHGPTSCSGLPVVRYSPEELEAAIGSPFRRVATCREAHETPKGATQHFVYVLFERTHR